jgi:hypothetical protein
MFDNLCTLTHIGKGEGDYKFSILNLAENLVVEEPVADDTIETESIEVTGTIH